MKINNESDVQINKAITLRESGKSDEDIFRMFPSLKDEISEIFEIIDMLSQNGKKMLPPKNLLKKVLVNVPRQNKTESILKQGDRTFPRHANNKPFDEEPYQQKSRAYFNILNLISNTMNKKTAMGMGIVILMLVFAVGASVALKGKRAKNLNDQNIAIENEINAEKDSFEQDSADLDELASDNSAEEIGTGLADIDKEVETASITSAAELELFEKELAYDLDAFSSDLDSTSGIENDNSLNTLSADLGGV
ncbi:MAG: hypothetical protein WC788_03335 [Candidatus Paceibacterota bacterium]|jgi:hypothetical protein